MGTRSISLTMDVPIWRTRCGTTIFFDIGCIHERDEYAEVTKKFATNESLKLAYFLTADLHARQIRDSAVFISQDYTQIPSTSGRRWISSSTRPVDLGTTTTHTICMEAQSPTLLHRVCFDVYFINSMGTPDCQAVNLRQAQPGTKTRQAVGVWACTCL